MGIFYSKEEKAKKKQEKEDRSKKKVELENGKENCLKIEERLKTELKNIKSEIIKLSSNIPVVSIQNPFRWKYKTVDIISSRATMGTGFWSEGASFWSDLMGTEDEKQNSKINQGEGLCISRLKQQCVLLGGNAVIGVDIDYSEIGSGGGGITGNNAKALVCTAGTAIIVENPKEVFSEKALLTFDKISILSEKIKKTEEEKRFNVGVYNKLKKELEDFV
ncbi:MAG: hypothetical protein ACJASR_001495 [Psychroserpens sp.]|jgi:uncharacterized protein YbjQ (UPF0145 family)